MYTTDIIILELLTGLLMFKTLYLLLTIFFISAVYLYSMIAIGLWLVFHHTIVLDHTIPSIQKVKLSWFTNEKRWQNFLLAKSSNYMARIILALIKQELYTANTRKIRACVTQCEQKFIPAKKNSRVKAFHWNRGTCMSVPRSLVTASLRLLCLTRGMHSHLLQLS